MNDAIAIARYFDAGTWTVGEIVHLGMFNGQVSHRYRITSRVDRDHVSLVPGFYVSVKNDDGTFSSKWVDQ